MKQENFILIISSPSGAGKTSVVRKIASYDPKFVTSISVTTRSKRATEIDAQDYYFVSKEAFKEMLIKDEFLEHTEIFDNYYASPKAYLSTKLSEGYDILFDIDWRGAESIKQKLGSLAVSIFILPTSLAELEKRLRLRQSNSEEDIAKRIKSAPLEINKYKLYDYVIINDNFDETIDKILTIIKAERLKRQDFTDFIPFLLTNN